MRKDWKYILYISLAFGLFVVLKLVSPKQHNWTVTFSPDDKNPYGGYAFGELVKTNFAKSNIRHSFKTLYELKDFIKPGENVLIICSTFSPGKEDVGVLLDHVARGGSAFISASYYYGKLSDTLKLSAYDNLFRSGEIIGGKDTSNLKFAALTFDTTKEYQYRRDNIHNYFSQFDTTKTTVIAKNQFQQPVTIRLKWGKGSFILNSTPMMFTNIYLLAGINHEFVSSTLSYLPANSLRWSEYYQRGRMEVETPLRFILQNEALRWAYYIAIVSLLVFMVFEMKRRQRIIPIIKPLSNTSLDFVNTIGNLYFQEGEHKGIAEKKINYLLEQIRTHYWLGTNTLDQGFVVSLSKKSGKPESEVKMLIDQILAVRNEASIDEKTLIELNEKIENFNKDYNRLK